MRFVVISSNEINKIAIQIIEAAIFVVCLDATSPTNSKERCTQFLSAKENNRWYDKTLQLVICFNGSSKTVCEHSSLDGITIEPLHAVINEVIKAYTSHLSLSTDSSQTLIVEKL